MKTLIFCCAFVSLSSFGLAQELEEVSILSSMDKTPQPAFAFAPDSPEKPIPLLVVLHTWSGDYKQKGHIEVALKECRERKWALIHPNFRGPNWTPEALGSPLAVQDIVDAVEWMKQQHSIDTDRIYLTGVSGGGHMSMQMAGKHPEIWAGVSAWVGISDVAAWHSETKAAGRNYFKNVEKAVGGAPGTSQQVDEQLKERSPLTWLARARSLPIDLNAGIHDGHTGSVPISQTFNAFNVLADANNQRPEKFTQSQIETMTKTQEIPQNLRFTGPQEEREHEILLRRQAGPVRITIFEGGHEGDLPTAIQWLSMQSR